MILHRPLHLLQSNVHWVLAAINIRDRKIEFYDSMQTKDQEVINNLRRYIHDEAKNKLGEDWDTDAWEEEATDCPMQDNMCDCGAFATKFADAIGQDRDVSDVTAERMHFFRKRMAADILNKHVPP